MPALEERGFYAGVGRRGLVGPICWVLTPAGAAAKANLEARLTSGWSVEDGWSVPGALRAVAGCLGAIETVDTAVTAIDAGVNRGWNAVYGD